MKIIKRMYDDFMWQLGFTEIKKWFNYLRWLIKGKPVIDYPRQVSGVLSPVAINDFYKRFKKINKFRPSDKEIKDNNDRFGDRLWISEPPQGTVCYNSVEVLT